MVGEGGEPGLAAAGRVECEAQPFRLFARVLVGFDKGGAEAFAAYAMAGGEEAVGADEESPNERAGQG